MFCLFHLEKAQQDLNEINNTISETKNKIASISARIQSIQYSIDAEKNENKKQSLILQQNSLNRERDNLEANLVSHENKKKNLEDKLDIKTKEFEEKKASVEESAARYNEEWSNVGLDDKIKNLQERIKLINSRMGLGGIVDWNYGQQARNLNMELQGLLRQQAMQKISSIQAEREQQAQEAMQGYSPEQQKPQITSQQSMQTQQQKPKSWSEYGSSGYQTPLGWMTAAQINAYLGKNVGPGNQNLVVTNPVIKPPTSPQGPVFTNPVMPNPGTTQQGPIFTYFGNRRKGIQSAR